MPAIERCLLNVLAITRTDATVLATTENPADDEVAKITMGGRVDVVRGSEEDVLERILKAADRFDAEVVVRVTGDDTLASYELSDLLIESHLGSGAEATFLGPGAPGGVYGDVYDVAALRRLRELRPSTPHSEYLIFYFRHNPSIFRLNEVPVPPDFRRDWRLTLDQPEDLELLELLFSTLDIGREPVSWQAVVGFFEANPSAAAINSGIQQGYAEGSELLDRLRAATTIES